MENKKIDFCMICKKKFDDLVTRSKEHIIPEAFGNTKLVTFGVCKKCNNELGRIVDSYLVKDNILSRLIRKTELEKDKDIGLFDKKIKTITGDDGREYLKKNNGFKLKTIIDIKENEDNIVNINATFSSIEECKKILTKKLRREFKFLSEQDIENILNNPVSMTKDNNFVKLTDREEINYSKICLGFMKIAYEYAVEKLGISYIENNFAEKIRNYLYKAITTKTDFNYDFCHKVCSVDFNFFDYNNIIEMCKNILSVENVELSKIRHFISLVNINKQLFCIVSLFNKNFLTLTILLSDNIIVNEPYFLTFITEDGEIVEF